ncbi:MAG: hypothetical protein Fur0012_08610 [Elusimicrobiota bacterium]
MRSVLIGIGRLYEKAILFIARRDAKGMLKKPLILLMGLKKFLSPGKKSALWLRAFLDIASRGGQDYSYYEAVHNENYSLYLSSCLKAVLYAAPAAKARICDFGCGRGELVKKLRELGYEAEGFDSSPLAIKEKVSPYVSKAPLSDFSVKKYEILCFFSVLEHIERDKIDDFLASTGNLSSDWIICSIPLYPENLSDFYDDPTHRIFECSSFWDRAFEKAGFYRAYSPVEPLPFLNLMIYRKKKKSVNEILDTEGVNAVRTRMSMGDNICILPALSALKEKFPKISFHLTPDSTYLSLLSLSSVFSGPEREPLPGEKTLEFHFASNLSVHLKDEFASQAGLWQESLPAPEIYLSEKDKIDFEPEGKWLAVDIRSGWESRRWPAENFEKTCRILKEKWKVKIAEVGKNGWSSMAYFKKGKLSCSDINFTDRLSLNQTAWVISKCGFFLGNDSGLAHLAAAVKARSFVLYGPAQAELRSHEGFTSAFFDTECYACYTKGLYAEPELRNGCPRKHHKCMKNIKPEMVAEAVAAGMGLKNGK